jgi:Glyoxalase-like domain
MAVHIDLTFDCVDGERLGEFWKLALGYEDEPPPPPFATRQEWLAHYGATGDGPTGAWLRDPDGIGPRLSFLPVPEQKVAKNRLHIDVRVPAEGTPTERWACITDTVARLTDAGATTLATFEGHHVVMADPEGNEFCVAYAAAPAAGR